MSYANPYQPYQRAPQPKAKRSIALFLVVIVAAISMLIAVPVARFYLIRVCDEYGIELPVLSLLVVKLYPELLALPILVAAAVIQFVVPSAFARNICYVVFLGSILSVSFLILIGFGIPLIKLMQSL